MSLYTYIDLYEYGNKIKNIGYAKSEVWNGKWKLKIYIRNLAKTDTIMCEMKTMNNEKYVDRFEIIHGEGHLNKEYEIEKLAERNIRFQEIQGLLFQLSSHKYGKCIWKNTERKETDIVTDTENMLIEKVQTIDTECAGRLLSAAETTPQKTKEIHEAGETNRIGETHKIKKTDETKEVDEVHKIDETKKADEAYKINEMDERKEEKQSEKIRLAGEYQLNKIDQNKWTQLGRMYSAIHPFHEKEKGEYISIEIKDFVILQEKYQVLVNNSFLLHGYFNYRHIILGKIREENKYKYYIGVPGVFHEREKMVAVMFGFERFMGVDSEEYGSFGYYMKEVQI